MLITTSYEPLSWQLELASTLMEQVQSLEEMETPARIVRRGKLSLPQLRDRYGDSQILLVSRERIEYYHEQQPALFFHPSTAAIRVKRLINGEKDTLLEFAGLEAGDSVLDCTAGLGSDSIVFSFATGEAGSVTALETSSIPYMLLHNGLCSYESDIPGLEAAMRRIRVLHQDHLTYLRQQEPGSFDVVYFDPMFRKPIHESSSIRSIRGLADSRALTEEAVKLAQKIARRAVVMKEHRDSGEFERLGFHEVHRSTTKIAYGVIRL